jgi:hypothetical protein
MGPIIAKVEREGDSMEKFEDLKGKVLASVLVDEVCDDDDVSDAIYFCTDNEEVYIQYHKYQCSETVVLEDICGDLDDLIGTPILLAEEVVNQVDGPYDSSQTWTFYKLTTIKGSVTIRWYGTSNGFYGETVDLYRVAGGSMYDQV